MFRKRCLAMAIAPLALLLSPQSAPAQAAARPQTPTPGEKKPPVGARLERGREFLGLGPAPDAEAAARGQTVFVQNCGFCHGSNARGAEGPNLVRSTLVLHDEHGNELGPFLQKGRPDRGMPAFPSLSPDQVHDIAEFLHARVEESTNRFGYKILNVVTGDAAQGKAFFNGHCTQCHSAEKELAHIASRFEPQDLQAQFLYPTTKEGADVPTVTVAQADGSTVSGKLKSIDDFHVSLITADGEFRRFESKDVKVQLTDPLTGHRDLLPQYTNADMHNVLAYLETLK